VFIEFELEAHVDCTYDYVQVYDGPDDMSGPGLGPFCGGKLPQPITTTRNKMFMTFKSDSSVQRKGFLAAHSTGIILKLSKLN